MFCSKSHCIKYINDLQENHEADRIDTVAILTMRNLGPTSSNQNARSSNTTSIFLMAKQKAAFPTKVLELCKMKRPAQFYTVNKLHWHFVSSLTFLIVSSAGFNTPGPQHKLGTGTAQTKGKEWHKATSSPLAHLDQNVILTLQLTHTLN